MFRKIGWTIVLFCSIVFSSWGDNPVVFLHGWNSDASIWQNLYTLLVQDSGYRAEDLYAFSYYEASTGFTEDTPIEDIAAEVAKEVTNIYYAYDQTPVDLVGHSMGGLIVRAMLAYDLIDPICIGRFISMATPNYGQNIDDLGGYESSQMKYGSTFLWNLAYAWHFEQRFIPETLCIEGIGGFHGGSPWDGLVHHWSASLEYAPRRYVFRVHSSTQAEGWYQHATGLRGDVIYGCPEGVYDPVYHLVSFFLYDGSVLNQSELDFDPPKEVDRQGGLFYQIIRPDGTYVPYSKDEGELVHSFHLVENKNKEVVPDYLEHGKGNKETQKYGIEFVYGTMPVGTYRLVVNGATSSDSPFSVDGVEVHPGRVAIYRLQTDGHAVGKPITVFFDPKGGKLVDWYKSKVVLIGDEYGWMPIPERKGYLFAGWRFGSTSGKLIEPEMKVDFSSGNHKLYADWVKENEVDPPNFPFQLIGDWIVRLEDPVSKQIVLQSNLIGDYGQSEIYSEVVGPGKLTFSWKASCETDGDALCFYLDSDKEPKLTVSGTAREWETLTYQLPAGKHLVGWAFFKDGSVSKGADCGWVKNIRWKPYADVLFDPNDGNVTPSSYVYPAGKTYRVLPTPVREGYSFAGWKTKKGVSVTIDTPVSLEDDFELLRAQWRSEISWQDALDTTLTFTGRTQLSWAGQSAESEDGADALQCFGFSPNQKDQIKTNVEGTGLVSFWSRVASVSNGVSFSFADNGTNLVEDSDELEGWKHHQFPLKQGIHDLTLSCSATSAGTGMDSIWFDQFQWEPGTLSKISFDSRGGLKDPEAQWTLVGRQLGDLPVPQRKGYAFLGWSSSSLSNDWVTAESVSPSEEITLYAVWNHSLDQFKDQAFTGRTLYFGYLLDQYGMVGLIQIRTSTLHQDSGTARVMARMQAMGEGRATLGGIAVMRRKHAFAILKGNGRTIELELGENGASGWTDSGLSIHAARNIFQTRSHPLASELSHWKGHWSFAMRVNDAIGEGADLACGYTGFSVSITTGGRARVYGVLPDGFRVPFSGRLMLSQDPDWACIPVHAPLYQGRRGGFAFLIWLGKDGTVLVEENSLWDASLGIKPFKADWSMVDGGRALPPAKGSSLTFELNGVPDLLRGADILSPLLPIGQEVISLGYRLSTPRCGRVTPGGIARDPNPAGLLFSYNQSLENYLGNCSFYTFRNGRLHKTRVYVNGAFVNGIGYGSARVRGEFGMEALLVPVQH